LPDQSSRQSRAGPEQTFRQRHQVSRSPGDNLAAFSCGERDPSHEASLVQMRYTELAGESAYPTLTPEGFAIEWGRRFRLPANLITASYRRGTIYPRLCQISSSVPV
jgi:hypothetical protein